MIKISNSNLATKLDTAFLSIQEVNTFASEYEKIEDRLFDLQQEIENESLFGSSYNNAPDDFYTSPKLEALLDEQQALFKKQAQISNYL